MLTNENWSTIDGERFVGLNICGFSAIKVFTEILSHCLGHKCSLFSTIKGRHLYSRKNSHGTPENREKCESLAQQIFPCLRYVEKRSNAILLFFSYSITKLLN